MRGGALRVRGGRCGQSANPRRSHRPSPSEIAQAREAAEAARLQRDNIEALRRAHEEQCKEIDEANAEAGATAMEAGHPAPEPLPHPPLPSTVQDYEAEVRARDKDDCRKQICLIIAASIGGLPLCFVFIFAIGKISGAYF